MKVLSSFHRDGCMHVSSWLAQLRTHTLTLVASLLMKYGLLIILTVTTIFQSAGQDIEYIVFTTQQIDEPPTKEGRPLYTIEFKRQATADFVASTYFENAGKRKLTDTITIYKEQVDKVKQWTESNKNSFNQIELGLNVVSLKNRTSNYKLNFGIFISIAVAAMKRSAVSSCSILSARDRTAMARVRVASRTRRVRNAKRAGEARP